MPSENLNISYPKPFFFVNYYIDHVIDVYKVSMIYDSEPYFITLDN